MAISLWQRIGLAWRGWSRRRADEGRRKREAFLQRDAGWGTAPTAPPALAPRPRLEVDLEGLQVAYLDDSGRIEHYLDLTSGEVVEFPTAERARHGAVTASPERYRRVPTRDAGSEADDRRRFLATVDVPATKAQLASAVSEPATFRRVLSTDRALERGWYNFKNGRATAAIEAWLRDVGLR